MNLYMLPISLEEHFSVAHTSLSLLEEYCGAIDLSDLVFRPGGNAVTFFWMIRLWQCCETYRGDAVNFFIEVFLDDLTQSVSQRNV